MTKGTELDLTGHTQGSSSLQVSKASRCGCCPSLEHFVFLLPSPHLSLTLRKEVA